MPGLPGSNFDRDLKSFQNIFNDSRFKPDMIKIYPCLVLKGTKVYDWWRKGEYSPYNTEEAIQLIFEVKKMIPYWIRIMRIQRDIPSPLIEAGVVKSNLRQLVLKKLRKEKIRCQCIRCREVGHRWLKEKVKPDANNIKIRVKEEEASGGLDIFISVEDLINDVLIGYLRLRIPLKEVYRNEIDEKTSIIRELHIYGPTVPIGKLVDEAWQHKGYGKELLFEGERLSQEDYDKKKVIITSALGTKEYFKQYGYRREGPYVSKILQG
jgi:elongator complex protein 3